MNDGTIDNQQVTQTDLAWLAGYLDGEGSFGIYGTRRKDGTLNYGARVQVASVCAEAIKKMFIMMKQLNLSIRLWNRITKNPKHHDAIYTTVNKIRALHKFLPLIIPYLTIKKAHAELLFMWVDSRVKKGICQGGNAKKNIYDDYEKNIIYDLKSLNEEPQRAYASANEVSVMCSELAGDCKNG